MSTTTLANPNTALPDFNNTQTAFAHYTDAELRRAYLLFTLFNQSTLVHIGTTLTDWAFRIRLPISPLVKQTVYKHFCGGETLTETDQTIQGLATYGVHFILDYGAEAKKTTKEFDHATEQLIKTMRYAQKKREVPAIVSKITGLTHFSLLQKIQEKQKLRPSEALAFERLKRRLHHLCKAAYDTKVAIYFDAEESWIQDTIDDLVQEMMMAYNKKDPIVYQTIQLYRKDKLEDLQTMHHHAMDHNYLFAAKLVRGAYMEKERKRAAKKGYTSPIQVDKVATDADYNSALEYCMAHIDEMAFCNATHNEASTLLLCQLMEQHQIPRNHPRIWHAQLYGMSDHLSFNLAQAGYQTAKYLPYGPVKDVMPYLIRRAQENTSVAGQMSRELRLITTEQKRRK